MHQIVYNRYIHFESRIVFRKYCFAQCFDPVAKYQQILNSKRGRDQLLKPIHDYWL